MRRQMLLRVEFRFLAEHDLFHSGQTPSIVECHNAKVVDLSKNGYALHFIVICISRRNLLH